MSNRTENHTIKLLQEMRAEMKDRFNAIDEKFDAIDEKFSDLNLRLDGMSHIMTLMAGHSHGLDARVERLEKIVLPD